MAEWCGTKAGISSISCTQWWVTGAIGVSVKCTGTLMETLCIEEAVKIFLRDGQFCCINNGSLFNFLIDPGRQDQ